LPFRRGAGTVGGASYRTLCGSLASSGRFDPVVFPKVVPSTVCTRNGPDPNANAGSCWVGAPTTKHPINYWQ